MASELSCAAWSTRHSPTSCAPFKVVDLADEENQSNAIEWWADLTAAGGEGMVVKPLGFIAKSGRGIQPGIKCRGLEYRRIIYWA